MQLVVGDIAAHAPEYREKGVSIEELFKLKTQCFIVANPYYGHQATVSEGEKEGGSE